MKVISTQSGFALIFDTPEDLDEVIESLTHLRDERKAAPTKSWPALLGIAAKTADDNKYFRNLLRWLRSRLGENFSD